MKYPKSGTISTWTYLIPFSLPLIIEISYYMMKTIFHLNVWNGVSVTSCEHDHTSHLVIHIGIFYELCNECIYSHIPQLMYAFDDYSVWYFIKKTSLKNKPQKKQKKKRIKSLHGPIFLYLLFCVIFRITREKPLLCRFSFSY